MTKDTELLALNAQEFYARSQHSVASAVVGFCVVIVLPLIFVYQVGWAASLYFVIASLVATVLSFFIRLKPLRGWLDPETQNKVNDYVNGVYSQYWSWALGILSALYVTLVTLVLPGDPSLQFPGSFNTMKLVITFIFGWSVYFLIHGYTMARAGNIKKVSQLFGVSEKDLIRLTAPRQLAPLTFSVSCASFIVYVWGAIYFLVGGVLILSSFNFYGISMAFFGPPGERLVAGLIVVALFGGANLYLAHGLRLMWKMAAALALGYSLMFSLFSLVVFDPHVSYLFLQPTYLNLIWLWSTPIAVAIIIWRNWGKMRWRGTDIFPPTPWGSMKREKTRP